MVWRVWEGMGGVSGSISNLYVAFRRCSIMCLIWQVVYRIMFNKIYESLRPSK